MTKWKKRPVEWIEGSNAYISVVFSWQIQQAYQRAIWLWNSGYEVRVGGPAAILNSKFFGNFYDPSLRINAIKHHNIDACFTSRGCIRKCGFCAVPKIEGDLVEIADFEPAPIVCDNNLLACSEIHFNRVVDKLKPIKSVDFNQGLDARLLTKEHVCRLAELDLHRIRLAWDNVRDENAIIDSVAMIESAGIPKRKIGVYVLIGFNDTPEDALYRLEKVRELGVLPNPMRYQPLDTDRKNSYVAPNWTSLELSRMVRYYSRLIHIGHIPYSEYGNLIEKTNERQIELF